MLLINSDSHRKKRKKQDFTYVKTPKWRKAILSQAFKRTTINLSVSLKKHKDKLRSPEEVVQIITRCDREEYAEFCFFVQHYYRYWQLDEDETFYLENHLDILLGQLEQERIVVTKDLYRILLKTANNVRRILEESS